MSSQNIAFSEIPSSIQKPGTYSEYNTKLAARALPANLQEVLIIGQKTASGSIAEGVPTKIFSEQDAILYSGNGSMVHRMVKAAYAANPYLSLSIVNLSDAQAGAQAAGTFTITGPATSAGTLVVFIGNERVEIAIAKTDANTAIATALNAALGAIPGLPVTAGVASGVVTVTAKNKGTVGNQIGLDYVCTATGVGVTVAVMASGATDPTLQTALTAAYAKRYHIIISPYNNLTTDFATVATYSGSSVATLKTHIDAVSGALEQRRGRAVIAMNGGLSVATTLAGNANDGRMVLVYLRGTRTTPCELAAAFGAVWASMDDPAQPLDFKAVKGVHAPAIASRLSRAEQETLLAGGVTPLEVGPGEQVQVVRAVSTYLLDAASTPDTSMHDVTQITIMDYVDTGARAILNGRYVGGKKTPRVKRNIRSDLLAFEYQLEALDILTGVEAVKDALVVEDDAQDLNRVDIKLPVPTTQGLHVLAIRQDLI